MAKTLHGMIFVISIDTGQVLDYIVKSKTCHQLSQIKRERRSGRPNMLEYKSRRKLWVYGNRWSYRNVSTVNRQAQSPRKQADYVVKSKTCHQLSQIKRER